MTGVRALQFCALVWKDVVVRRRHLIWSSLELTVPILVCALAVFSGAHQGRPKLEPERTFDADDFDRIYGDLTPARHTILVAPNTSCPRALVARVDEGVARMELVRDEAALVARMRSEIPASLDQLKRLLPDDTQNSTVAAVFVRATDSGGAAAGDSGQLAGHQTYSQHGQSSPALPTDVELTIRARDFRLPPAPLPKKASLGPFLHSDHYAATFFIAAQMLLSRAYIALVAERVQSASPAAASAQFANAPMRVPSAEDIVGQRMPYPRFVVHKRLRETTLGTFVAGAQKQKPFTLAMDQCVALGFLVAMVFLAKRLVDERKSRVRDMLRLVGVSDWTYYGSHAANTLLIMLVQCFVAAMLFAGTSESPAANSDPSLVLAVLGLYACAAVAHVMCVSSLFGASATRAIVCTALVWLGAPEALDRVFRLEAGVAETGGFVALDERLHLLLAALVPNFGLRLASRLLAECDIYGEFYARKHIYGEYTATWPNINHTLPLYKHLTLLQVMLALVASAALYVAGICLQGLAGGSSSGLVALAAGADSGGKQRRSRQWSSCFGDGDGDANATKSTQKQPPNRAFSAVATHKAVGVELGAFEAAPNNSFAPANNNNNNNAHLDEPDEHQAERYFEPAAPILECGLRVRNVCKSFARLDAVKNVSLDLYYSQILVLLGHNGAGKTTLIDIISGHQVKTSGTVEIDGHDIDKEPREARRRVGFCPQIDVLFDQLTVEEHLIFYGLIKGLSGARLRRETGELLSQSGMTGHRRKLAKALSGGYKRKLSLAIAMTGSSKLLILDEPTSGMDPESRRKVWDFLELVRRDRLVLMTTHHMEEADALGDRIAIMSAGRVRCCGSPLFLKRSFDAGYHLRVCKAPEHWSQAAFEELVCSKFSLRDKLEHETPHELVFKFAASETGTVLPQLFDDLDKHKARIGVYGFGITVSTMDDVFMRLAAHFKDVEAAYESTSGNESVDADADGRATSYKLAGKQATGSLWQPEAGGEPAVASRLRLTGRALFKQQLKALIAKRSQHTRKNWFQLVWILCASIACVVCVVLLLEFVIFKEELTPEWERQMTLTGAGYGTETRPIFQIAPEAPPATTTAATSTTSTTSSAAEEPSSSSSLPPLLESELSSSVPQATSARAEPATADTAPASPLSAEPATAEPATAEPATADTAPPSPSSTAAPPTSSLPEAPATTSEAPTTTTTPATEARRRRRIRTRRANQDSAQQDSETTVRRAFLNNAWLPEAVAAGSQADALVYSDVNTEMIDLLTEQFSNFREKYVIGGEKAGDKYIAWYSGEATHSFPISMNVMLNSILRQVTQQAAAAQSSGSRLEETPATTNSSSSLESLKRSRISLRHHAMSQINTLIAFLPHLGRLINLVFLPFSIAFITSYFVIFPTHERVTKSKHLQLMTGVSTRTFWLAHFIFDLALYAAYTLLTLAIYFAWDRVLNDRRIYFATLEHSLALIALVSLFVFAALPMAYIFSFLAKKPTGAFSSLCVIIILTGTATLTLVSLYEIKYEQHASSAVKIGFVVFLSVARLLPSVSLLVGLQKLFSLNTTRSICINISPEVLDLLCKYINTPIIDEELQMLKPHRCCKAVCQDECFDQWPFFWSGWFGINVELAMLVVDAALLWFLLVLMESPSLRSLIKHWLSGITAAFAPKLSLSTGVFGLKTSRFSWCIPQFNEKNKDLLAEQAKIDSIVANKQTGDYSMVVSNLKKVYSSNSVTAVDGLSFAVDRREFFGLLGVNGAGKSTTFKALTGELKPTSGNAWVGAFDVFSQRHEYLRRVGYCPQQDALIDQLTGSEMLALFARLRGIPEPLVAAAVQDALRKLGLLAIASANCNNYSGGNKRRLSVAMALIGAPEVIFLDEPTSGVDPASRRKLWATLIDYQRRTKSSIVMTSHSMNECESLCDRVAIMVGGQFKVLGSIQYLRTKLSRGYSLVLKVRPQKLTRLDYLQHSARSTTSYLLKALELRETELKLKDLHQTVISYHVAPNAKLTWSRMLTVLEKTKQDLDLEDYQITSDANLESIFLSLAKQQVQQLDKCPSK